MDKYTPLPDGQRPKLDDIIRHIRYPDDPPASEPSGSNPPNNGSNQGAGSAESTPSKEITVANNPVWRRKQTDDPTR